MPTAAAPTIAVASDQGNTGLGLRVEVVAEMPGEARVSRHLLGDRRARHVRLLGGGQRRRQQRDHSPDHDAGADGQENHHWRWLPDFDTGYA